jgi:hypothetical protein
MRGPGHDLIIGAALQRFYSARPRELEICISRTNTGIISAAVAAAAPNVSV